MMNDVENEQIWVLSSSICGGLISHVTLNELKLSQRYFSPTTINDLVSASLTAKD